MGARSSLHSQCTAAHLTTNVHALKEKPPNLTWVPWGHEGDVALWGANTSENQGHLRSGAAALALPKLHEILGV